MARRIRSLLTPDDSPAVNYAFDVTPRRYVTGLITERGICEASKASILNLFPEKAELIMRALIYDGCVTIGDGCPLPHCGRWGGFAQNATGGYL